MEKPERVSVAIRGTVQGVGFRPFVYRLATGLHLAGWVANSTHGLFIEVEGPRATLDAFLTRLEREKPPRSSIHSLEPTFLDPAGYAGFKIRESLSGLGLTALIPPDIATCEDCLNELFDPGDRRYLYPFTNCTNCGPRYSIIVRLPYDRQNTTMAQFALCDRCRAEYENPLDRRFHAQPVACPDCGPQLELWAPDGSVRSRRQDALKQAAEEIRLGRIVALKGIGGFQLIADAVNEEAVRQLRSGKHREEKPFALMFPSIEAIRESCEVSGPEERLLRSAESPIVLLRRRTAGALPIAAAVAPDNPSLGIMLPYSPLHHLLMRELGRPVVATSGNRSDEPICTDERDALHRLARIADVFLVHDRPIRRHVDDSIVRIVMGREMVLRRSRGYAPLPVRLEKPSGTSLLAVGPHLKNTVAVTSGDANVFVSQHIGDLETKEALAAFRHTVQDLGDLYHTRPGQIICDLHPDYVPTKYARSAGLPVNCVQHHYAHVASGMMENHLDGCLLGVSWDGTGYGPDGTIWGGEFLRTDQTSFRRVSSFRPFPLPGGDAAIREPRRAALGLLFEGFGEELFGLPGIPVFDLFNREELKVLRSMLGRGVNSPRTSSAGRLFDAVASLTGVRHRQSFEGQAAMELEFLTGGVHTEEAYPIPLIEQGPAERLRPHHDGSSGAGPHSREPITSHSPDFLLDWHPMVKGILADVRKNLPPGIISAKFHNALANAVVSVALRAGEERVLLSGGCFQNVYLTERTVRRLESEGFRPYWHQRIPPNDGGIAAGQIYAWLRLHRDGETAGEAFGQSSNAGHPGEDNRTAEAFHGGRK